jgi:hypothetical protein
MKPGRLFRNLSLSLGLCYLPLGNSLAADSGLSWSEPSVSFHIGNLNGADNLWKTAFEEAALRWNDAATQFRFNTTREPGSGYCTNLGNNNVRFSTTNCGDAWGSTALGVTAFWSNGSQLTKADISFNNSRDWNVYDGNLKSFAVDFRRVAAHEMGHAVGLAHSVATNVLMSTAANNTFLPALDDVNSLNDKYGSKTHILTIENFGDGKVIFTPKVAGTGVKALNTFHTSNYTSFLDCKEATCQIPVQDGLRLIMTAVPDSGAVFVSWEGTTTREDTVALSPMTSDRKLVANFTYLDGAEDPATSDVDPATSDVDPVTSDVDPVTAQEFSTTGGGALQLYLLIWLLFISAIKGSRPYFI